MKTNSHEFLDDVEDESDLCESQYATADDARSAAQKVMGSTWRATHYVWNNCAVFRVDRTYRA